MASSASQTGSHLVANALVQAGTSHVFGVPGESLVSLMNALVDRPEIRMVITRHEEGAAFAAEAYAKASGQVGVCFVDRAVGAAHAAVAVHVAHQDSTPMVVLVGANPSTVLYREAFQEIDIPAFLRPMTKWQGYTERASKLPELVAQAFRAAVSGRPGPVVLSLPEDTLGEAVGALPQFPRPLPPSNPAPDPAAVARAVDVLLSARQPAIIAGGGVLRAQAYTELAQLAEALGALVYAGWRRFDVMDHAHPHFAGCLGLGIKPEMVPGLANADAVLAVGCRLSEPTTLSYRLPAPEAALVQVDVDAASIGKVRQPEVGLVADAKAALAAFATEIARRGYPGSAAHQQRLAAVREIRSAYTAWGTPQPRPESRPVDPQGVIHTLQAMMPPDTAIVTDAGYFASWGLRYYRHRRPGTFFAPTAGAMGYAMPGAIGVKLATPHRPVVAMAGDGGLLMTVSELETAVRLELPMVILVFNNNLYGGIKAHQMRQFPGRHPGVELGNPDFAALARTFGAFGARVEQGSEFPGVLQAALAEQRPALIEIMMGKEPLSALS